MASRAFLVDVDLSKNQLLNARIQNLASAPSSPVEGQVYYNTTDHKFYYYNGTEWIASSVEIEAGDALTLTSKRLDVIPGTSLEINSDKIRLSTEAAGNGLGGGGAEGLKVNVGVGLDIAADAVRIASEAAGNGLGGGGGSALEVKTGSGIEISSDAVRIAAEAAGEGLGGGGGSALKVNTGSGIKIESDAVVADTSIIATREFAESLVQGLDIKASVRLATKEALPTNTISGTSLEATANGALSVDGKTAEIGNRILVKNEAEGKKDGIYEVIKAGGAAEKYKLTRTKDADATGELTSGSFTFVEEGTTNENSGWVVITDGTITIGTTAITWEQFSGAGQVIAGGGIGKTGNELFVEAGEGLTQTTDGLKINTSLIPRLSAENTFSSKQIINAILAMGSHKITEVSEPTENQDAATKKYVDTAITAVKETKTTYSTNIGNGSSTEFEIEHKLGTRDVQVELYRNSSPYEDLGFVVERPSSEKVKIIFNAAPGSEQYRVVIFAGGVGGGGLTKESVTPAMLTKEAKPFIWYTPKVIATEQARASSSFGTLTTPDEIKEVVVPENGMIAIAYSALWKESEVLGRAAIFIGENQLKVANQEGVADVQAAISGGDGLNPNVYRALSSCPAGLVGHTGANATTNVTTGQALGFALSNSQSNIEVGSTIFNLNERIPGGLCHVTRLAAGTYTVSIRYRAVSGSVTAKERYLAVGVMGY